MNLALTDYSSTVLEAGRTGQHVVRYGIPAYRLSCDVLHAGITAILDLGVELRLNPRVSLMSWKRLQPGLLGYLRRRRNLKEQKTGISSADERVSGVVEDIQFMRYVTVFPIFRAG